MKKECEEGVPLFRAACQETLNIPRGWWQDN